MTAMTATKKGKALSHASTMPRTTSIRTGALEDLATQLRFAPSVTILRQAAAIEALAREIKPDTLYPEDFLIFKVTGYRTPIDEPAMIVGSALLADLSALAEQITAGGRLTLAHHDTPGSASIDDLRERWRVSRKTIERYRRQGLIARRLRKNDGKEILRFTKSAVEHFERAHPELLTRARGFCRMDEADARALIARAREIAQDQRISLSRCAHQLAREFGRSHETVRSHLGSASPPVFPKRNALSTNDRTEITRRLFLGTPASALAERFNRSPASIRRIAMGVRISRLPRIDDLFVTIIGPDEAGPCPPETVERTAQAFALAARTDPPLSASRERTLALAYHSNIRAAAEIAGRSAITTPALDEAETHLRRAVYLKRALMHASQRIVLGAIQEHASCEFEAIAQESARRAHRAANAALSKAIDRFDPTTGGRLAARAGISLSRALARLSDIQTQESQSTNVPEPEVKLYDWTRAIIEQQASLLPPELVGPTHAPENHDARSLLMQRFGLASGVPRTIDELAKIHSTTRLATARRIGAEIRVRVAEAE